MDIQLAARGTNPASNLRHFNKLARDAVLKCWKIF